MCLRPLYVGGIPKRFERTVKIAAFLYMSLELIPPLKQIANEYKYSQELTSYVATFRSNQRLLQAIREGYCTTVFDMKCSANYPKQQLALMRGEEELPLEGRISYIVPVIQNKIS